MANTEHSFSKRTAWDLRPSDFSAAIAAACAAGRELLDLTVSNPTACGFDYDSASIFAPLSSEDNARKALIYEPDPRGLRSARESVARYYSEHGATIDPDSLILTTSTSEAYSYLFRLLCDPGDEVLVAQPSYPLFDFLATLDDVTLKPYPLFYDYGWWIDFAELERRIGPRTRAIIIVHPNNPTGHWTHRPEREKLEALCARHGLALIVDEVFLDFSVTDFPVIDSTDPAPAESFATEPHPILTFILSGISKICALPQMKIAWIAVFGPDSAAFEALARLEVVADTFLSMNAPTQLALPRWLVDKTHIQAQIQARVRANLETFRLSGMEVLKVEAGWSAIVRVRLGESAALLLERTGVIVHPGQFYSISDKRAVVVSLITPVEVFKAAIARMSDLEHALNLKGYPIP